MADKLLTPMPTPRPSSRLSQLGTRTGALLRRRPVQRALAAFASLTLALGLVIANPLESYYEVGYAYGADYGDPQDPNGTGAEDPYLNGQHLNAPGDDLPKGSDLPGGSGGLNGNGLPNGEDLLEHLAGLGAHSAIEGIAPLSGDLAAGSFSLPAPGQSDWDPMTTKGSILVNETFTGPAVADPNWQRLDGACLTRMPGTIAPPGQVTGAILDTSGQFGPCVANGTAPDSTPFNSAFGPTTVNQLRHAPGFNVEPGFLQLTAAANYQRGAALYNHALPANAGLSVTFDMFMYGRGTLVNADGIGFFLIDGAHNLTRTGGMGGSMGYVERAELNPPQDGIVGGFLGLGFDSFGNFVNDGNRQRLPVTGTGGPWPGGQIRGGCPARGATWPDSTTRVPHTITMRGPGRQDGRGHWTQGYCLIDSTISGNNGQNTTLRGVQTLSGGQWEEGTSGDNLSLLGVTGSSAADRENSRRRVNVQVTPTGRVAVSVFYPSFGWFPELDVQLSAAEMAAMPSTFKFGWSAATGGQSQVHLIRNVVVGTTEGDHQPGLLLSKQVSVVEQDEHDLDPIGTQLFGPRTDGRDVGVLLYEFAVANTGNTVLTNLRIEDSIIDFTPGTYGAGAREATQVGEIRCESYTLQPAGEPGSTTSCWGRYRLSAADWQAGQVLNVARAHASWTDGPVTSNDDDELVTFEPPVVVTSRNVSITKSGPTSVVSGQIPIEFTLRVENHGPDPATNVLVTDQLPPGTLGTAEFDPGMNCDWTEVSREGDDIVWSLGTLAPGQQCSMRVDIRTPMLNPGDDNVTLTNWAFITTSDPETRDGVGPEQCPIVRPPSAIPPGPCADNRDSATVTVTPPVPGLELVKTLTHVRLPGGDLTPVTLDEHGYPRTAANQIVVLVEGAELRYEYLVTNTQPLTLEHGWVLDDKVTSLIGGATTALLGCSILDTNGATTGNWWFGGTGNNNVPSRRLEDGRTARCLADYTVTAGDVAASEITNVARAFAHADRNPGNSPTWCRSATACPPATEGVPAGGPMGAVVSNRDDVTVRIPIPNLRIDKAGPATAIRGQNVDFTITAHNDGPIPVSNAVVSDFLPAGLTFVSQSVIRPTGCATFDQHLDGVVTWNLAEMTSGAECSIRLTARTDAAGVQINEVFITSDQRERQPETTRTPAVCDLATIRAARSGPDVNPIAPMLLLALTSPLEDPRPVVDPAHPCYDNFAEAPVTVAPARNLRIAKTVDGAPESAQGPFNFLVTAVNDGPDSADDVRVLDRLPAGWEFLVEDTVITTCEGMDVPTNTGGTLGARGAEMTFHLGTMPAGASCTISIAASPVEPVDGTVELSVDVHANVSAANAGVQRRGTEVVVPGGFVTFDIWVDNLGDAPAPNVLVANELPNGLRYVSSTVTRCAYAPAAVAQGVGGVSSWTIHQLPAGSGCVFSVTAEMMATTAGTQTTQVSAASDEVSQSASASVEVLLPQAGDSQFAAMHLSKTLHAVDLAGDGNWVPVAAVARRRPDGDWVLGPEVGPGAVLEYHYTVSNTSAQYREGDWEQHQTLMSGWIIDDVIPTRIRNAPNGGPGATNLPGWCTINRRGADWNGSIIRVTGQPSIGGGLQPAHTHAANAHLNRPGETATCRATHVVQQADLDHGFLVNNSRAFANRHDHIGPDSRFCEASSVELMTAAMGPGWGSKACNVTGDLASTGFRVVSNLGTARVEFTNHSESDGLNSAWAPADFQSSQAANVTQVGLTLATTSNPDENGNDDPDCETIELTNWAFIWSEAAPAAGSSERRNLDGDEYASQPVVCTREVVLGENPPWPCADNRASATATFDTCEPPPPPIFPGFELPFTGGQAATGAVFSGLALVGLGVFATRKKKASAK